MPKEVIGALLIFGSLVLMLTGMRIGYVTFLIGIVGFLILKSPNTAITLAGTLPYSQIDVWDYTVIPMFILMGYFLSEAGLADEIFLTAQKWVGHLAGGVH
jgi:TRAP-type mannitol/chloroaromatic compound transport system permease large subunit